MSELTELRLGDIRLIGNTPCLNVDGEAENPSRAIPLEAEVCDALDNYLSMRRAEPGTDHLFVNRDGRPLSTRSVQRLLRHYARAAQLDGLTTQALRYVYARTVYEQCGDLKTVNQLLGHRHVATTIRYLRPYSGESSDF